MAELRECGGISLPQPVMSDAKQMGTQPRIHHVYLGPVGNFGCQGSPVSFEAVDEEDGLSQLDVVADELILKAHVGRDPCSDEDLGSLCHSAPHNLGKELALADFANFENIAIQHRCQVVAIPPRASLCGRTLER